MPVRELFGRRRVPILAQIHPDHWEEVLLGLNARMLILNGVRKVIAEHAAAYSRSRG